MFDAHASTFVHTRVCVKLHPCVLVSIFLLLLCFCGSAILVSNKPNKLGLIVHLDGPKHASLIVFWDSQSILVFLDTPNLVVFSDSTHLIVFLNSTSLIVFLDRY